MERGKIVDKLANLLSRLRVADDCVNRAMDGIEHLMEDGDGDTYAQGQCERASSALTDAKVILADLVGAIDDEWAPDSTALRLRFETSQ